MKTTEYLSLFDYLKKPAGKELGNEVKRVADENNIPFKTRQISNPKFTGTVCLYPQTFLEFYFRRPNNESDFENYVPDFPI